MSTGQSLIIFNELKAAHRYYDGIKPSPTLSFQEFFRAQLRQYPREVLCEVCGGQYVIAMTCPVAEDDDPEQSRGMHITIQRPIRPWNQDG